MKSLVESILDINDKIDDANTRAYNFEKFQTEIDEVIYMYEKAGIIVTKNPRDSFTKSNLRIAQDKNNYRFLLSIVPKDNSNDYQNGLRELFEMIMNIEFDPKSGRTRFRVDTLTMNVVQKVMHNTLSKYPAYSNVEFFSADDVADDINKKIKKGQEISVFRSITEFLCKCQKDVNDLYDYTHRHTLEEGNEKFRAWADRKFLHEIKY